MITADKSGKILPAVSSEKKMPFHKLAENKAAWIQKMESGQTISFIFEETDIASFLNAFAKSAEAEMHHCLSLFTIEFDAGAK